MEPLESALLRQAAQIERELTAGSWPQRVIAWVLRPVATQRALIAKIRGSSSDTIRVRGVKVAARWLRELLALDPAALYRRVRCPVLLVGGAKDLQCLPTDVARIAELAGGPVEAHVVPDLTHVLRRDDEPPTMQRYPALLERPIEPAVLDLIEVWARRQDGA